MKYITKLLASTIVALFMTSALFAQNIEVVNVDPSNYPEIFMEFHAYDTDGNKIRNFNWNNDIEVTDGGLQRDLILNKSECPKGISKVSLVLILDLSLSMSDPMPNNGRTRFDFMKNAALVWIDALPEGRAECSIIGFSSGVYRNPKLLHKWVPINDVNRQTLKDSVNQAPLLQGTNYNSAFFGNPNTGEIGAFDLAKTAKYKPVFIFITDGGHDPSHHPNPGLFRTGDVVREANELDVSIYSITIADISQDDLNNLNSISGQTGGDVYFGLESQAEIESIIQDILTDIDPSEYPAPCYVTWNGHCESGKVNFIANNVPASTTFTYNIPDSVLPKLAADNKEPFFLNPPIGQTVTKTVTLTAIDNFVEFTGINSSDPAFGIQGGLSGRIDEDGMKTITITYTAPDSTCHEANYEIEGSACRGNVLNPHAGWFFVKTIDVGSLALGKRRDITVTQRICNWTCIDAKIDDIIIKGDNAGDFKLESGISKGSVIPAGTCVDIVMQFDPQAQGDRKAKFVVKAFGEEHEGDIIGYGIGDAKIEVADNIDFGSADCQNPQKDKDLTVKNLGELELVINNISFGGTDFSFVPAPDFPDTIDPQQQKTYTIRFEPGQNTGNITDQATITSNAKGQNQIEVELTGVGEKVEITTDKKEIDFGTICPDSVATEKITLTNEGTMDVGVNTSNIDPFTMTTTNWNLTGNGGTSEVSVNFSSSVEGAFEEELIFTDDYCNYKDTVIVKGIVAGPEVTANPSPFVMSADIGSPEQKTLTLTNNSDRDLQISDLLPQNGQFTIISVTPPNKIVSANGGTAEVVIEYDPTNTDDIDTELIINGTPCNYTKSIALQGRPGQAVAELSIRDDYEAMIGGSISVNIDLINKSAGYSSTNISTISLELAYDNSLLTPSGYTNDGVLELNNIPTNGTNADETLVTINFDVESGATVLFSDLAAFNAVDDGGSVLIVPDTGRFTVKEATARLYTSDVKAEPGEVFDMTFFISDASNLSADVNEGIEVDISFNATLIEPAGNTPEGTVTGTGKSAVRTIRIDDLPIVTGTGEQTLKSYKFRAMLGNAETTEIVLSDPAVKNGQVSFDIDTAMFELEGICRKGNTIRLLDPYANTNAGFNSIVPNPVERSAEIEYTLVEPGYTSIWLVNTLGEKVRKITAGNMEPDTYNFTMETSDLNSGLYMIILQTPTDKFSRTLQILK